MYHVLRRLAPPGMLPKDDACIILRFLRADAKGLGHGKIYVDQLASDAFPQTARNWLELWEADLDVVPKADATLGDRINAVLARWKGSRPSSLAAIREMLSPLLNPVTAFDDDFNSDTIWQIYKLSGNGTKSQAAASNQQVLAATLGTDVEWSGTTRNANVVEYPLPDTEDGFTLWLYVTSATLGGNLTGCGMCLVRDDANALMFGPVEDGAGTQQMQLDSIIEGAVMRDVGSQGIALTAAPYYLRARYEPTTKIITFAYGASLSSMTDVATIERPWPLRSFGWFVRNDSSNGSQSVSLAVEHDDAADGTGFAVQLTMDTQHNNVRIHEHRLTTVGDASDIFFCFVHRPSSDSGDYDINNAIRICDRIKDAHTVVGVGESVAFLTDDPESLTDRDVLGE